MDQQWGQILFDVRKASEAIEGVPERLRSIEASNSANAKSIDELYNIARRPAYSGGSTVDDLERKDAEGHCRVRRALTIPKVEGNVASDYTPSPSEIDEALTALKAMRCGVKAIRRTKREKIAVVIRLRHELLHSRAEDQQSGVVVPGRSDRHHRAGQQRPDLRAINQVPDR
jgi:hypothetical protein